MIEIRPPVPIRVIPSVFVSSSGFECTHIFNDSNGGKLKTKHFNF
jgi:hypothetical protein